MVNNNQNKIKGITIKPFLDYYYDFCLSNQNPTYISDGYNLYDNCLISSIDSNNNTCIVTSGDSIVNVLSNSGYTWINAIASGETLYDIGLTGLDNGFIDYDPNTDDLKELFTQSTYTIPSGDTRLKLYPIKGYVHNNLNYNITYSGNTNFNYLNFNGGFLQGFFKLDGFKYQTLPTSPNKEISWEFVLRPKTDDTINDPAKINYYYPNNSGFFFYIGTRAENKFWYYTSPSDLSSDYNEVISGETAYDRTLIVSGNTTGVIQEDNTVYINLDIQSQIRGNNGYTQYNVLSCSGNTLGVEGDVNNDDNSALWEDNIVNDPVPEKYCNCTQSGTTLYPEIILDSSGMTSTGVPLSQANTVEFETDNKFLLFNQTGKDGTYTTDTFDESKKYVLNDRKKNEDYNYFLLFNQTQDPNTFTTNNVPNSVLYDNNISLIKDSYYNCIGFRITKDNEIGYRYLTKNCDTGNYEIIEQYSEKNIVNSNDWNHIVIRYVTNAYAYEGTPECHNKDRNVIFKIYVNGKLKFTSDPIKELNLRSLDEIKEKQEGVPYNISLGGGTQGLLETILLGSSLDKRYSFTLEKEFCGSFIGDISIFNIHDCPLDYTKILNNYRYYKNSFISSGQTFSESLLDIDYILGVADNYDNYTEIITALGRPLGLATLDSTGKLQQNVDASKIVSGIIDPDRLPEASAKGDLTFCYIQSTPTSIWMINHNMNKYPSVTIEDNNGNDLEGDINYIDLNNLTITFNTPFSGKATLN